MAIAIPSWTHDITASYCTDEVASKLLQEVTVAPNSMLIILFNLVFSGTKEEYILE
jgi:hypothetical protein